MSASARITAHPGRAVRAAIIHFTKLAKIDSADD